MNKFSLLILLAILGLFTYFLVFDPEPVTLTIPEDSLVEISDEVEEGSEEATGMHPSWDQDGDGVNDCENDGSCDHTVDYTQPRPDASDLGLDENLIANSWQWKETVLTEGDKVTPEDPTRFTALFDNKGTFSSTTDCNNMFGSYTGGAEGILSFGPLASTRKACMGQTLEFDYADMLSRVESYLITDEGNLALMMKSEYGSIIFEPVE